MPTVWVFPKLESCLKSGVVQFELPERELRVLRDGCAYPVAEVGNTDKPFIVA
jgi:hypothetical protein